MSTVRAILEGRVAVAVASGILECFSRGPAVCVLRIGDDEIGCESVAPGLCRTPTKKSGHANRAYGALYFVSRLEASATWEKIPTLCPPRRAGSGRQRMGQLRI